MPDEKYTLYGLAAHERGANVSTWVFVTMCDMAILGVDYDLKPLTFPQIRGRLAKETGNDQVTVPTLLTGTETITDSWEIAKWLEKHHSTPTRSLFHGHEGAAHIDPWVGSTIAPAMRPLFRPGFYARQDEPSREYFLRTKYMMDEGALRTDLANMRDPVKVAQITAGVRHALRGVEDMLGRKAGPFIMGERPSHADSSVFAWYLAGQLAGDANLQVWESDELPRVKRWVGDMKRATGLDIKF